MRVVKSHPLVCCANLSKGKTLKASVWMHKLNGEAACVAFQMVTARQGLSSSKAQMKEKRNISAAVIK